MELLTMIDVIAWIGAVSFSICAIPQAWECYKQKHARGLAWSFLILWLVGEGCFLVYSIYLADLPLMVNYVANGLALGIIMYYKARGKSSEVESFTHKAYGAIIRQSDGKRHVYLGPLDNHTNRTCSASGPCIRHPVRGKDGG